ncbi:hypothetical protein K1719_023836 [Acacia pycnantha]|nr:hypothetical protein K1719_023836 [Acacia pycnantha]
MAGVGESSSAVATSKPVVVRVKRKSFQSPIDAFWLEINERPLKRPLLDFANLSLSDSVTQKAEELNAKKVFVQHVETISIPDVTFDVVQHFMDSGSSGASECKSKIVERKELLKKDNKHDQLLLKAKEKHESTAKNARFEQIWKSRRGNKESVHAKSLQEICHFYDVVRVDEEKNNKAQQQEHMSLEDQRLLCSYLPLLKEFIPDAAVEIESDMHAHREQDDYVYDIYTVNEEMDITVEDTSNSYPLVQVDEDDDYYDGPQESDYESDDSNAENNPLNDYPDEISEGEVEDNEDSDDDSDEREGRNAASDESSEEDFRHVFSKDDGDTDLLNDEDFDDDYDLANHDVGGGMDDEEEEEDGRQSYR